ncbi:MAG TPA: hypothetical protein PKA63_14535 [Oligoflexia bacterium]|nr:hypothetical protein [Oligoflexia bacterium]HMP49883.1 hypothetical protein [Oligoflexia bacterium]
MNTGANNNNNSSKKILDNAENYIQNLKLEEGTSRLENEVRSVSEKSTRLFNNSFAIDKETTELFRAMCILSQCSLEGASRPSSHRPLIGPAIVFVKQIIWKLVEPRFKFVFAGVQDCFSHLISSHAKLLQEVKMLQIEQDKQKSTSN